MDRQAKSYANNELLQYFLRQITPGSDEIDVINLWQNMLYLYFFHDNVGVQYQNWAPLATRDASPLFVDFIVVKLEQDVMREKIFVECKRPREDGQRAGEKAWENARKQMERYMNTWKARYQPPHPHYYAIINIGAETRFFVMNRRCCAKLKPFHDDPWTFSLWDDTVEVNDNLKEMFKKISRG